MTGIVLEIRCNAKGFEALNAAIRLVSEIIDDQPWNDQAKEALDELKTARKNLRAERVR